MDVEMLFERLDAALPASSSYVIEGGAEFFDGMFRIQGRVDGSGPTADVTTTTPEGSARTIIVDDVAYLQGEELAGPDTFVQAPLDEGDNPVSEQGRQALSGVDQGYDFSTLRASAMSATTLGQEEIGEESLERVRLAIDPALAAEAATDDLARRAFELEIGQGAFTYDLWLDPDGLLSRIAYAIDGTVVQFDYSGWGRDQKIRPPDPDTVITVKQWRSGPTDAPT